MALSKELVIVIMCLIHTTSAINLNFFNFNKGASANETKPAISIEPTKTVSASLKITEKPIAIVNSFPEPDVNVDIEKHEFENETEAVDASPEITSEGKPSAPNPAGQEIDETRNSSSYFVQETIDEDHPPKETSNQTEAPKVSLPKLHSLPKRKTVTFTNTILSKFTKYETVYPSCIKWENVRSTCDGILITIQPTPTLSKAINEKTTTPNQTDARILDEDFDVIDPQDVRRKRSSNSTITLENLKELEKKGPSTSLIEPSELDYEFEEFDPVPANRNHSGKLQGRDAQPISAIQSLLLQEPKFEFVTEYVSSTSVQTVTNYDFTATVIVHNCVPRNMNLRKCSTKPDFDTKYPIFSRPIRPIIRKQDIHHKSKPEPEIKKNEQKIFAPKPSPSSPHPEQEPQKPLDSINELNDYLIMNANRFIHGNGGGYGTIDLNAGSTIIEPSEERSPVFFRRKSMRVKRE